MKRLVTFINYEVNRLFNRKTIYIFIFIKGWLCFGMLTLQNYAAHINYFQRSLFTDIKPKGDDFLSNHYFFTRQSSSSLLETHTVEYQHDN